MKSVIQKAREIWSDLPPLEYWNVRGQPTST